MTEDVEARLRAALRAHADLVQAPPDGAVRPVRPSVPARRLGRSVLVAAAAAAVVAGTVWLGAGSGTQPDQAAAPSAGGPAASAEPSDGRIGVQSAGVPPPVGVARPFDLPTHCGVLGADVAGVWFAADPPLTGAAGHPPEGWADPVQPGTLTLLSPTEAVFRDDAGHEVRLRAVDAAARPGPCG